MEGRDTTSQRRKQLAHCTPNQRTRTRDGGTATATDNHTNVDKTGTEEGRNTLQPAGTQNDGVNGQFWRKKSNILAS